MSNIHFTKIKYANFLSTGNGGIETNLDQYDSTVIWGKNGTGKSTLYEALYFGLYGKAFRRVNKGGLLNNINNKRLLVEIEFVTPQGKYKVKRGIKPNIFEIYKEGKLVDQGCAVKDYQRIFENNVLKMSDKTFKQIVILGSSLYTPFMRLNAKDRRDIIEELLNIQVFSYMNSLTKDIISRKEGDLSSVEHEKMLVDNSIFHIETHITDHTNNVGAIVSQKRQAIAQATLDIAELESTIMDIVSKIAELSADLVDDKALSITKDKLNGYIRSFNLDLARMKKELAFFDDNDTCPSCNQDISEDTKQNNISNITSKQGKLMEGVERAQTQIAEIQTTIDNHVDLVTDIRHRDQAITHNKGLITNLKQKQNGLEQDCKDLHEQSNIEDRHQELDELKDKLAKLDLRRGEVVKNLTEYKFLIKLLKDDGIKSNIIKTYLPVINKLISKYLQILEFPIKFQFDEMFNERVVVKGRTDLTYNSFSEGERMRIDLSLLFAFRELAKIRTGVGCNLLIFDEILDAALDTNGIESFMSIIKSLGEDANIYVISHGGDAVRAKFDAGMKFQKQGKFSELAMEK